MDEYAQCSLFNVHSKAGVSIQNSKNKILSIPVLVFDQIVQEWICGRIWTICIVPDVILFRQYANTFHVCSVFSVHIRFT